MKLKKILIAVVICMGLISTTSMAAVVSDNLVHQYIKNDTYYIQAYFNPSHKVQSGEGYSLKVGKYVKQAYVRVQSDGLTVGPVKICGSYDSQRVYSSAASTKTNKIMSTSLLNIKDCGTCTQYTNYGWIYF